MIHEVITLVAGGRVYDEWKAARVSAALNDACRRFDLSTTEIFERDFKNSPFDTWKFPPGTRVELYARQQDDDGRRGREDLLCAGFVDRYNPTGTPEMHNVRVTGRSMGQDFVDSSVDGAINGMQFVNSSVLQIAQQMAAPFGVAVAADAPGAGAIVPNFQARVGSTNWAEMMRLLPQYGLTMTGLADGSLLITNGRQSTHSGGLVQGENAVQLAAELTSFGRFRETRVYGQASYGTDQMAALQPKGVAIDSGVSRYRLKVIVDSANSSQELVQQRANWEASRAIAESLKAEIVVPGFRDGAGRLWEPGFMVHVWSPWLKIDQYMTIEAVEFSQDSEGGTLSTLQLVAPTAYGERPPPGGSDSGPEWDGGISGDRDRDRRNDEDDDEDDDPRGES